MDAERVMFVVSLLADCATREEKGGHSTHKERKKERKRKTIYSFSERIFFQFELDILPPGHTLHLLFTLVGYVLILQLG